MLAKQKQDSGTTVQRTSNNLVLCQLQQGRLTEEVRMTIQRTAELLVEVDILRRQVPSRADERVYEDGDEPFSQAELEAFTAQAEKAQTLMEKFERAIHILQ